MIDDVRRIFSHETLGLLGAETGAVRGCLDILKLSILETWSSCRWCEGDVAGNKQWELRRKTLSLPFSGAAWHLTPWTAASLFKLRQLPRYDMYRNRYLVSYYLAPSGMKHSIRVGDYWPHAWATVVKRSLSLPQRPSSPPIRHSPHHRPRPGPPKARVLL